MRQNVKSQELSKPQKMTESLKLEVNFNSVAQVIEETILKVN
jgi:hypothetical protein